ncbi:hypothetical protein CEXT_623011 [Caerostris extrusa]|uniref:Uncharacterized protein n=1 Tax=Caerostris extrusa TaxID=172846 RepID=A0AAV4XW65_CAEEX|nr:hypothetical protein CEXT_623011 [Caerostris extrusa]
MEDITQRSALAGLICLQGGGSRLLSSSFSRSGVVGFMPLISDEDRDFLGTLRYIVCLGLSLWQSCKVLGDSEGWRNIFR